MSIENLIREEVRALTPYSSARSEAGTAGVLLNANESAEGVLNRYPQQQPAELLEACSRVYGAEPERVLISRGSDEAIDLLVRTFGDPGASVVTTPPTFGMYGVASRIQGMTVREVPLTERWQLDVEAILEERPRLLFICSPNNPTGNLMEAGGIRTILDTLGEETIVVVDEAYVEFSGTASWVDRAADFPQLVVLRTMSKAHALAAARIGVTIADERIIAAMRKVLPPYPLPQPSIDLALKALTEPLLQRMRARVAKTVMLREEVARRLAELSIVEEVYPSDANFLFLRFRDGRHVLERCERAGFILRGFSPLPDHVRITIGALEEMEALLDFLENMDDAGASENGSRS